MTTNFFSPLSFVAFFVSGIRDPGSGMGKNQDPGSEIRDKHPGSATLGKLCFPLRLTAVIFIEIELCFLGFKTTVQIWHI
jgi:hypothetical protein